MVGRRFFPIGFRPIFRGYVSFREGMFTYRYVCVRTIHIYNDKSELISKNYKLFVENLWKLTPPKFEVVPVQHSSLKIQETKPLSIYPATKEHFSGALIAQIHVTLAWKTSEDVGSQRHLDTTLVEEIRLTSWGKGSLSPLFTGFGVRPRWLFGISSINSSPWEIFDLSQSFKFNYWLIFKICHLRCINLFEPSKSISVKIITNMI